ncbi:LacI family DNA-binding transcriptional regulator [Selenomonas sp. ND2010]|uniref:LacI family DNA-binding transcriptional regulator n=1 Tax=Selenomonas sp. ND2010 TaxID=1410618 RepID=UPI00051BC78D|nr:LacI family DNA-binding transcriptional regulator [Selenomonas sp. ND2010]
MVTIKQIAELCGVSRGTVDRVLNNRGNVKPEKRQLVLETAKKLNYQPNPAGKALAARKKNPVVGVLIASEGVPFFDDVLLPMRKAALKYENYGMKVLWRSMRGFNVEEQCSIIDELASEVNALIINPVNEPRVIEKLNDLVARGIFVVTINNDVDDCRRHCYVGTDYLQGGRTAGALLKMIAPPGIHAGVLMGSLSMQGHRQRLQGFLEVLEKTEDFQLTGVHENEDDDMISYEKTRQLLEEHPETNALFIISSGAYGAARAVMAKNRRDIVMVVFDTIPSTIRMMHDHIIQAAIYQHPRQQGRKAMQVVFDYLVNGFRPDQKKYLMRNEIRILENVEE